MEARKTAKLRFEPLEERMCKCCDKLKSKRQVKTVCITSEDVVDDESFALVEIFEFKLQKWQRGDKKKKQAGKKLRERSQSGGST